MSEDRHFYTATLPLDTFDRIVYLMSCNIILPQIVSNEYKLVSVCRERGLGYNDLQSWCRFL